MARYFVALALCALAACAAAQPVTKPKSANSHVLGAYLERVAEEVAVSLESEVEALMIQANQHHKVAHRSLGSGIMDCANLAFTDAIKISAHVLDIAYKVRALSKSVLVDFNKCEGNIITATWCKISIIKDGLKSVLELKTEGTELLKLMKESVNEIKSCISPPVTTTLAPTAAPTDAPTAAPTDAPTPAPGA